MQFKKGLLPMIQEIKPHMYHNEYYDKRPSKDSNILQIRDGEVLIKKDLEEITYPCYTEYRKQDEFTYLFSIDGMDFFLVENNERIPDGYEYRSVQVFRTLKPKYLAFAGITAHQLYHWYQNNRFCGKCGAKLQKDQKERMLHCSCCGNMVYPKISPAVIVAITDKDKLLLTKYANRNYTNYSLVAGFAEIGETIEETVEREVMEEVGLKVKNIRYYKSQPWSYSDTLLMGFYAELDGDSTITLDETELSVAEWVARDEITSKPDDISLTNEMIIHFKNNK
jgi:NAD+ diphosphatase